MSEKLRIAVVGTGAIGRIHAEQVTAGHDVDLAVLCGLDEGAPDLATRLGAPLVANYEDVIHHDVDGVVIATPNQLHAEMGIFFLDSGLPVLVEKPITDTLDSGIRLCGAAIRADLPILVGQHRRYNPLARRAREVVAHDLGTLIGTSTMISFRKPDTYYEPEWRRGAGAGPLLINLIHEVDLLRFVCDEIDAVQATSRRLNRPYDFDDTAAVTIHYRSGAVGTIFLSDSTPAPWSWEGSVSEGMGFHNDGQDYSRIMGTDASLSLPSLTLWRYDQLDDDPGWLAPLHNHRLNVVAADPYALEIAHFARVIRREAEPVVDGHDGLRSLAVVAAVVEAGESGGTVNIDSLISRAREGEG